MLNPGNGLVNGIFEIINDFFIWSRAGAKDTFYKKVEMLPLITHY